MSKGLGHLQRSLVTILGNCQALDTFTLAAKAYEVRANEEGCFIVIDSQLASVKRALASLKAKGKVFSFHRGPGGRRMWAGKRFGLYVTIKDMQQRSVVLAAVGDEQAFRTHAESMLPLIERASNLGVDINETWSAA